MGNKVIAGLILFGMYKFIPNSVVKTMVVGVGGVMLANYVPYVNNKTLNQTIDSLKAEA